MTKSSLLRKIKQSMTKTKVDQKKLKQSYDKNQDF